MNLLKIARVPPIVVAPHDTVKAAVEKMCETGVGAVAVVDKEKLVGIFTERDLMRRVVRTGFSPQQMSVSEVMTPDPLIAPQELTINDAIEFMTDKHFRHLPITDHLGRLQGMLSVRHLMRNLVENLSHELEGLNAYISVDGSGGD